MQAPPACPAFAAEAAASAEWAAKPARRPKALGRRAELHFGEGRPLAARTRPRRAQRKRPAVGLPMRGAKSSGLGEVYRRF